MREATRRGVQLAETDDPVEGMRAHRRLQQLYEVSKLLTQFESVEKTLPAILALVSDTAPLCIASLMLEDEARRRVRVVTWHAKGASAARLEAAGQSRRSAYAHLVRPALPPLFEDEAGHGTPLRPCRDPTSAEVPDGNGLLLPLVVGQNRIFGALQVQGVRSLTESDLMFVNAIVNQLAIALDRARVVQSRQDETDERRAQAERSAAEAMRESETQRFLSETGEIVSSSLDLRRTVAAVARAAVPLVGDVCLVDEIAEDGQMRRVEVVIDDPSIRHLADRARQFAPAPDWDTPADRALRARESIVVHRPSAAGPPESAHAQLLDELGVASTISVPLVARGQALGVLTFASCRPGRRYSAVDVAIAEKVGRRASIAIDNAQLYESAQREIQARQDLLAVVSHELRNPLASMSTALSILNFAPRDLQVSERARGTMGRQLAQMVRLVDDLLDVSRITGGKLELRRETVELASVLHQAVESCRAATEMNQHELVVELPKAPVYVLGDATRLVQVFSNLLANACKFTDRGGHIRLAAEVRGTEVSVSVRDDGIGVSPSMLTRIFDMFAQADTGLERAHGGLGIGLTLVRSIVEMHDGSVEATSGGEGQGSEFVVVLPVSGPPDPPAASPPPLAGPAAATASKVLVVDDNLDGAASLSMLLRLSQFQTFVAHDGLSAIAMAAEFRPDVVLLDIGLPKMSGYEVARRIRAEPWGASMLLVATTGWGEDEDRRKSKEAGFDHHLVKPVDMRVLMRLLGEGRSPVWASTDAPDAT